MFGCDWATCKSRVEAHFGPGFNFEEAYAIRTAYVRAYLEEHGVPVKPGLFELLDVLDTRGIKKCVATSTARSRADQLLSTAGLRGRFGTLIGGDSVSRGKPHPDIFLTAAETAGVKPENCLVLEDSAAGMEAAAAAGMRCIAVPDMSPPDAAASACVNAVCADLREAADVILSCYTKG